MKLVKNEVNSSSKIQEILGELRQTIAKVNPPELQAMAGAIVLDCRESEEVELGIIPGSVWVPKGKIDLNIENEIPDKGRPVVVYCAAGTRSLLVAKLLLDLGYQKVFSLDSGYEGWKNMGYPIAQRASVKMNRRRYKAQLALPEIGEEGQARIGKARVLLVGCGGLGSPTALYLAAAGVGTLGLADDDLVDESNLQRQILHSSQRIGVAKVESAFMVLKDLNPAVNVVPHRLRVSSDNIDRLVSDYDVIIDGCDNFDTRYLVNLACLRHKKVNIHGSVFAFQGQVSIFCAEGGPCYQCLFPEPPGGEVAPNCAEGGVLGAVVGVTGSLVAVEALKWILGHRPEPRMFCYDGLHGTFDSLKIKKDMQCKSCSIGTDQIDYSGRPTVSACGVG